MMTSPSSELRADHHSIEPIPDADRDSTGLQQMWIWAGANIAPVNWALGALGIVLKLGLWETIAVIVVGNLIGCAIFAAFTVMGHKTGVNQMVLSRSAFGRRGAYLPSALMFLMTLGWIGVNTYFPVKIAMAILGQFGIADTWLANLVVITLVMVLQVRHRHLRLLRDPHLRKIHGAGDRRHHGADEHPRLDPAGSRQLEPSRARCRPARIWRC